MIEKILINKFDEFIDGLDIYENKSSLILTRIIIKPEFRNSGIGSKIMEELIKYADNNQQIIALTPSNDFGGSKNRLIQFYKRFGFKHNQGQYKNYQFMQSMVRYPKQRIKEVIKNLLRESLVTKKEKDIRNISDFVNFAKKYLGIEDDIKVELAFERTPELKTTAYYDMNNKIVIYVKDRAIVDVMRSLAHELTHHKQNLEGRITNSVKDGADGSDIENEANAKAGELIRKYGKLHPEVYS